MTRSAVAIVSGGMDSVTLGFLLRDEGFAIQMVSFEYGQRHAKELEFARRAAERMDAPWHLVDLRSVTALLTGSALTDDSVAVPLGHYAAATMRATVVPNRNMMMVSIAAAVAVAGGAQCVAAGIHAGDHPIYPDCRPSFVDNMTRALRDANDTFCDPGFHLYAPFMNVSKAEIVTIGTRLGVPWADTWSCYQGGATHCGLCGTCVERREAFQVAGLDDPTAYLNLTPVAESSRT